MRVLIDECLDWRLCRSLPGHDCASVQRMGWHGLKNGDLLREAQQQFEVFITADRNLAFQQPTASFNLAVIVLHAGSIQLPATERLMPSVLEALETIKPGMVVDVYP